RTDPAGTNASCSRSSNASSRAETAGVQAANAPASTVTSSAERCLPTLPMVASRARPSGQATGLLAALRRRRRRDRGGRVLVRDEDLDAAIQALVLGVVVGTERVV